MLIGCCKGNHGFTTCAVKNINTVVFILKCTRYELPFLCCGAHFRKQMCLLSRLQCTIMQFKMAPKRCIKCHRPHRPWKINQTGRSNRKREYAPWTQFDCSNEKRWTESWNWVYFYPRLCVVRLIEVSDMRDLTVYNLSFHVLSLYVLLLHVYHFMFYHSSRCYTTPAHSMCYHMSMQLTV